MGTRVQGVRRDVYYQRQGFRFIAATLLTLGIGMNTVFAGASDLSEQVSGWRDAVVEAWTQAASMDSRSEDFAGAAEQLSADGEREFPVPWDWFLQDAGPDFGPWLSASTAAAAARTGAAKALAELGTADPNLRGEFDRLASQSASVEPHRWLDLYLRAAVLRREIRLRNLRRQYPRWIFTKHHTLGGSHYAYTEGQSDAQHERQFDPDAALCRLDIDGTATRVHVLIEDSNGVIRDPDVSWDGRRVLFAWKKSDREDDYHLYEMTVADGSVRQVTRGLGFADYEGIYLPNGDLLFNSTRCVQTVDCWWTEVSNLYTCRGAGILPAIRGRDALDTKEQGRSASGTQGQNGHATGRFLRRLTFDQVHDNFPTVTPDGRIIYTRWEYSDRGQLFVQGLFQMNPDGTGQTELYGNDSWFPTSLLHARGIPGTHKVVAIFSGHHSRQAGKLGIIDPARGRQENAGTQLIAPVRDTPPERIDAYGQEGDLYQYPYPLCESEFVVACAPLGWSRSPTLFKLYWIAADGRRELLAADPEISCNQPVPLAARKKPPVRANLVDYRKTTGTCFLQDVYEGPGLAGIPRGTVQKLRVIGLAYRAAGVGWNYNAGPAGDALVCTPVAVGNGSWDVKTVLGEAIVHPDGSALFTVPARTPVYFQAIDARGYAVQTMRSWVTLQPDENASCVGCHEAKNSTPRSGTGPSMAMKAGPQDLTGFHGPPRGFSFPREIQPILDRHCTRCHNDTRRWEERLGRALALGTPASKAVSRGEGVPPSDRGQDARDAGSATTDVGRNQPAFNLLGTPVREDLAKRQWSASYLALVQATEQTMEDNRYLAGTTDGALVNWIGAQSVPTMLPPYAAGAARSRLLSMLADGHYDVRMTPGEMEKIACWIDLQVPFCGDYEEANLWTAEDQSKYRHFLEKRRNMEEQERRNIAEWLRTQAAGPTAVAGGEGEDGGR
jgi:hypothetical protein